MDCPGAPAIFLSVISCCFMLFTGFFARANCHFMLFFVVPAVISGCLRGFRWFHPRVGRSCRAALTSRLPAGLSAIVPLCGTTAEASAKEGPRSTAACIGPDRLGLRRTPPRAGVPPGFGVWLKTNPGRDGLPPSALLPPPLPVSVMGADITQICFPVKPPRKPAGKLQPQKRTTPWAPLFLNGAAQFAKKAVPFSIWRP